MSAESLATASLLASSGACLKKDCAQGGKPAPKKEEDYTGIIKRTRPLTEVTRADVTLVEFTNIDCDGAPIVDAFPSTGVVSVLAGMQLVKSMGLPLVGVLKSLSIPSVATVQCEQPSHPARIYGNRGIVIFVCEISLDEVVARSVADLIYDFARRHRCPMIYTVEGMATGDTIKLESGEEVSLAQEDGEGTAEEGMHTEGKEKGKTNEQQTQEEEEEKKSEEGEGHENGKKGSKGEKDQKKGKKEQETTKKEDDKKAAKTKKESKKQKQKKKREEDEERSAEKRGDDGDDNKKEAIARKLYGDKVHFVTTDPALAQKLRGLDCVPVVDGVISGVTGAILAEAALVDQEVTGLVVPTSTIIPSAKSAIVLLQLLEKLVPGIAISVSELEKLEDELEEVRKAVMKALPALTPKAPPSNLYL
ncbi:uncharacterized protein ACA1_245660 [Acanthamoeba castellanii str. Neff]|uniref:Proteasome assembly chaperone family protein n=1 Tax=Acanthamoeba castellanii (strain ATCC 30010 / Neff) TaxID=1257118 RepID=L8GL66_ACACF|nr:uncharacterized protein ACA1_245660 [Acanthamoeba castellanii str. Neff]ELR13463.1 hypothetical protein ACA1_245660 [Acanthamoeba castellanii str. Neff]